MFTTTPLGVVHLRTAAGTVAVTVSHLVLPGASTATVRSAAAASGLPIYRAVTLVGEVAGQTLDLHVRAENVDIAALPTSIQEAAATQPIAGLITEYRHRLADLAVHLGRLGLATGDGVAVTLTAADLSTLRHLLDTAAGGWRDAAAGADAAAERPPRREAAPGHMNVEPTPGGYRSAATAFRSELARLEPFAERLGTWLKLARQASDETEEPRVNADDSPLIGGLHPWVATAPQPALNITGHTAVINDVRFVWTVRCSWCRQAAHPWTDRGTIEAGIHRSRPRRRPPSGTGHWYTIFKPACLPSIPQACPNPGCHHPATRTVDGRQVPTHWLDGAWRPTLGPFTLAGQMPGCYPSPTVHADRLLNELWSTLRRTHPDLAAAADRQRRRADRG
jgi:hypothetical protein